MENASEALLIAGGILLAILTISAFVLMFNNVATIEGAQERSAEAKRLAKWNAEWEAYNKKLLYGTEVLTVMNKAKQNNIDYYENDEYKVNVELYDENENPIKNQELEIRKIYSCMDILYNENTGRVKTIMFKIEE